MTEPRTEIIKTRLPNNTVVYIEAPVLQGEEEIGVKLPKFSDIAPVLEGIAQSVVTGLEKVSPQKVSVEFGLEVALESGNLTALITKGSGKANLTVTLEWEEQAK